MVEHMNGKHADLLEIYRGHHGLVVTAGGGIQTQRVARRLDSELSGAVSHDNQAPIRKITLPEQQNVNKLLGRWVARHFRPMIVVEDEAFKEFVFYITHQLDHVKFALPNRSQLRNEIVALAVYFRKLVTEDILHCCVFYSLTSDIWTGRDGHSYISLTIHFLTEAFELRSWTLEVQELPGIHDGVAIATALNEMRDEWGLSKEYCTKLGHDGGTNMVSAADIVGVPSMSCIAHSLHLVVAGILIKQKTTRNQQQDLPAWTVEVSNETAEPITEHQEDEQLSREDREQMDILRDFAIEEMETYLNVTISNLGRNETNVVRGIIQRFHTLACYFRKSPKGQNRLDECQVRARGIKRSEALRVQVDCPTRWNSCWEMLQRLIVLESSLVRFFAYLGSSPGRVEFAGMEDKLWRPKASDWLTIKCLTSLLAPFGAATTALSGQQYPTMALVVPILHSVRKHLSRIDLFAELIAEAGDETFVEETHVMMNDCRRFILKLFDQRFRVLENSELAWVAYLDPRIGKRMSHLSAADRDSAEADLLAATRNLARECRGEPSYQTPVTVTPQTPSRMTGIFLNDLFGPDEVPEQRSDLGQNCADEFTLYLSAIKTVRSNDDPLLWWRVNRAKFPNLSRIARKWLGAVATSVPSERAFSTSGNILTVKRSSLAPSMVRYLHICAAYFVPTCNQIRKSQNSYCKFLVSNFNYVFKDGITTIKFVQ
ncbi:unnamed protein product [Phytophthora fragariaefolia]|uniref:Unnamed protein product n=1 Tax=Phytophthora fragariaefolia TaxID=1490495 RepID=A0A9W6UB43_9STRA|nr:unnamed protein product [Phytophthora fragariaefolia]